KTIVNQPHNAEELEIYSNNPAAIESVLKDIYSSPKVFSIALSRTDPKGAIDLLDEYLSNVVENYYNIDNKLHSIELIRSVIASLPDDTAGKEEFEAKI